MGDTEQQHVSVDEIETTVYAGLQDPKPFKLVIAEDNEPLKGIPAAPVVSALAATPPAAQPVNATFARSITKHSLLAPFPLVGINTGLNPVKHDELKIELDFGTKLQSGNTVLEPEPSPLLKGTQLSARTVMIPSQGRDLLVGHGGGDTFVQNLLSQQRELVGKTPLIFFYRNPGSDFLRKGPLGLNVVSGHTEDTAVAENVVPRLLPVAISFFPSLGYGFTKENIGNWEAILKEIDSACGSHDGPKADLICEIDNTVRKFADCTFFKINQLRNSCRDIKDYKPESDLRRFFTSFYGAVNICIRITRNKCMYLDEQSWGRILEIPVSATNASDVEEVDY